MDSDSDSSVPVTLPKRDRRRIGGAGGGKRPKLIQSSGEEENGDYELRPHASRVSFKRGTFKTRRTIKDLEYSSDDDDAEESIVDSYEDKKELVKADWDAKLHTYRLKFPKLYQYLELEHYMPSIVPTNKIFGNARAQLEMCKVVDVCRIYGKKIANIIVYYEDPTYCFVSKMSTQSSWNEAINSILNECTEHFRDTFTESFDDADIGIVTTRGANAQDQFHHRMVMFKQAGAWVLVDSNSYNPESEHRYTAFQKETARIISTIVQQSSVQVISTRIQEGQRETYQWLLDAFGLCHAFSTLTAVLLIKTEFDYSEVTAMLNSPNNDEIAYLATVFCCSCVRYYMPTNWSVLRVAGNGGGGGGGKSRVGGGGGKSRVRPYALTGLTNIKNPPLYEDPDTYKSVAFYIHKGHCKHFLPSLVYDVNKHIWSKDRWDTLEVQFRSKDLGFRTRVSTVQDLLDEEKFPKEQIWLVTIHMGKKGLVEGFWKPFRLYDDDEPDQIQVLSSDDPFKIMSQMGGYYTKNRSYQVTLNCIEFVNAVPYTGQSYMFRGDFKAERFTDSWNMFFLEFYWGLEGLGKITDDKMRRLESWEQWDMYVMSSDTCKVLLREPNTTEREKATNVGTLIFEDNGEGGVYDTFYSNEIIPDYMSSYYLHEWKPAVTVFFVKRPRHRSTSLMLLLC